MLKRNRIISILICIIAMLALCGCSKTQTPLPTTAGSNASGIILPADDSEAEPEPTETPAPSTPLPSNTPEPTPSTDETQADADTTEAPSNTCTLMISCITAVHNAELLPDGMLELLPADGLILPETEVTFEEGDTAFDILLRETRERKIHMEYNETPGFQSCYIEGIANLYEFDCGPNSGWHFCINNTFPGYGSSEIEVKSGDRIEFLYTCDRGRDLGAPQVE